ncbi:MAG: acetyl-CoA hydrolase, partial [Moraxellaceae bacterium]|nr:acetyl-CoA hydrolase [Pseudobdellovibrionaceae bacterium]
MNTTDLNTTVDFIFKSLGPKNKLAAPLGLGKPNDLLNAIYDHVEKNPDHSLSIFTALSLAPPEVTEDLAARFFTPFKNRHWGENYPVLKYYQAAQKDLLPENIQVHEFYFQAGTALKSNHLQRNYQSVNYTHVAENILNSDIQVLVQLIAKKETPQGARYSLSCNPDLTLDVVDLYKQAGKKIMIIGVVHPDLPFLDGEAEIGPDFFAAILDTPKTDHQLFALPRLPMSVEDHFIGFYASLFVKDGGTVQIGIGSLSDAIVHALIIREKNNLSYTNRLATFQIDQKEIHHNTFTQGLYGLTEMLTDSFMHLHRVGILKRHVVDEVTGNKTFVHGSFFIGSKDFYQWLRELKPNDRSGLRMTRVSKVNDLHDPSETRLRLQRVHARFFNTTMQVSLLGDAASETLNNGKVISGVGGQYNFVSMAHELKGARSILMLRSVRIDTGNKRVSNIISGTGHFTIPRHLRDIIITEYGIANLRGKTDEDCVKAILNITDSEFQNELLKSAQKNNKVSKDYQIPFIHRNNDLKKLYQLSRGSNFKNEFNPFPFGSDFTPVEEKLVLALEKLKAAKMKSTLGLLLKLFSPVKNPGGFTLELERMNLTHPKNLREK